jgi:hypothetical protein
VAVIALVVVLFAVFVHGPRFGPWATQMTHELQPCLTKSLPVEAGARTLQSSTLSEGGSIAFATEARAAAWTCGNLWAGSIPIGPNSSDNTAIDLSIWANNGNARVLRDAGALVTSSNAIGAIVNYNAAATRANAQASAAERDYRAAAKQAGEHRADLRLTHWPIITK